MSVFISWRGSDREIKNSLVEKLRAELGPDEEIWESDENCQTDIGDDCIRAIRQCQVFVLILSDAAMEPSYVINEVIEGHRMEMQGKLNIAVYRLTDAELTPRFAFELNHIPKVRYSRGLDGLIQRVKYLLNRRKNGNPEKPYDVYRPEIQGTALSRTGYFVENSRDSVFREIDEAMDRSRVVFITQLSGYGRKSAVRKYLELNAGKYESIISLPFFTGSLRDFFVQGLVIRNLNEDAFSDLNEDQVILRKSEILNKLDDKTVIVVPNTNVDSRDDRFILDVLSGLRCRVIFVTQSSPRIVRGVFPVVSVGRMDDQYLEELFFHCYPGVNAMERRELAEPLRRFFNKVDGHTKSVELTAMALSDEFGIYPEDIPGILENVCGESREDLSRRIFDLISNLFDFRGFSAQECRVLYVAALMAETPMDEKEFLGLLENCGCCDRAALRRLVDRRWIDNDQERRTLFIEPLLALVCIDKIPRDDELIARCFYSLKSSFYQAVAVADLITVLPVINRFQRLCGIVGLPHTAQMVSLFTQVLSFRTDKITTQKAAIDAEGPIRRELEQVKNEDIRDTLIDLLDLMMESIRASAAFASAPYNEFSDYMGDQYMRTFFGGNKDWHTIMREIGQSIANPTLRDMIENLGEMLYQGGGHEFLGYYISMTQHLLTLLSESGMDDVTISMLELLGDLLIFCYRKDHYLCLQLCRIRFSIHELTESFLSVPEALIVAGVYLESLKSMAVYTEEMDQVFRTAYEMYLEVPPPDDVPEWTERGIQLLAVYTDCMLTCGRTDTAQEAFRKICELPALHQDVVLLRLQLLCDMLDEMLSAGDTAEARSVVEEFLPPHERLLARCSDPDAADQYGSRLKLYRTMLEETADGAGKPRHPYQNYYQTYARDPADRRLTRIYSGIADKAAALDYSGENLLGLRKIVDSLKKRASDGADWKELAPEAFALVSEAGRRVLGYGCHYVQFLGAAAIADGRIAEILNGEGKTYAILPAAFLWTLYGKQVHVLDSSPYLCRRNYEWMGGVLRLLGCLVGHLEATGNRNEGLRRLAGCQVIYATVTEVSFARMKSELNLQAPSLRFDCAIVDEADQVMIAEGDERVTITSAKDLRDDRELLDTAYELLRDQSGDSTDLYLYRDGSVTLRPAMYERIEEIMGKSVTEIDPEEMRTLEQFLRLGVTVLQHYVKNEDYFVRNDTAYRESLSSGRFYAVSPTTAYFIARREKNDTMLEKLKFKRRETLDETQSMETLKTYERLSGTTATASGMKYEFRRFYDKDVYPVPPDRPVIRTDEPPVVFLNREAKNNAVADLTALKHATGQPVLIITDRIPSSREIYGLLQSRGIEATLINAENEELEDLILGHAGERGAVTVATAMANRGTDICLGGNPLLQARESLQAEGEDRAMLALAAAGMNTADPDVQRLKRELDRRTAENRRRTDAEKAYLEEMGGLCVIGTCCFEELRVEQQMRGRSGRQGSPGESHLFYSLDDSILHSLLGVRAQSFQTMFADFTESLDSSLLNSIISQARQEVQKRKYDYLAELPSVKYFAPARKLIMDTPREIVSGKLDLKNFLYGELTGDPDYLEQIRTLEQNRQAVPPEKLLYWFPELPGLFRPDMSDSEKLRLLRDRIMEELEKKYTGEIRRRATAGFTIHKYLEEGWKTFLFRMNQELELSKSRFDLLRERSTYLEQFCENLARDIYREKTREGILRLWLLAK